MPKNIVVYICIFAGNSEGFDRYMSVEPGKANDVGFTVGGKRRKWSTKKYYATTSKKDMNAFRIGRNTEQTEAQKLLSLRVKLQNEGWKQAAANVSPSDEFEDALAA